MDMKTELQRNAIIRGRQKELESFQRALDVKWLDSRMEDGRMGRCLALIKKEAEMEKDFQERTDHAAIVNARAEKETALGIEIGKVRQEENCQLLRRHYLRERDPSLRELMRKLQGGYICRDLQLQIQNNEYKRLQEKAEQKRANDILRQAMYSNQEAMVREEQQKMERTAAYKRELQQQLVNRERQRRCQYEESLIEKKMLEDIMRTLSDEDQRELAQKREITERLRNEMITFKQARDAWKEKQKRVCELEEKQIEKQKAALADRTTAVVAERERKIRAKEKLNEVISSKILAAEAERLERDNIIKLLQEQEYLEKNFQADIREKEKMERSKRDTKEALTAQMENKRKMAERQREKEADFRRKTEERMADDERKAREKETKKREESRRYSEQLQRQGRDNGRDRGRDQGRDQGRDLAAGAAWQKEVLEERRQIVKAHVPHLLGYLQTGVVAAGDIPAVTEGAAAHQQLAHLDVESLATSRRPQRVSKCNAQCRVLREY